MEDNKSVIGICRICIMWVATAIETLFGGADGILLTLLAFMLLDIFTGLLSAIVMKKFSTSLFWRGIIKKIGVMCIVSLASFIERFIIDTTALRTAVILYYISNEGISIFENIAQIGVPIPKKLSTIVNKIIDDDENGEN